MHDSPGVGRNLSDHYILRLVHQAKSDYASLNEMANLWPKVREFMRFALQGRGTLTNGVTAAQVFCHSREGLASPDIQLLFTPASYEVGKFLVFEKNPGFLVAICPTRPSSRGTVMAESKDPLARPAIRPNYLTDPDDMRVLRAGFDHARRIFGAPACKPSATAKPCLAHGFRDLRPHHGLLALSPRRHLQDGHRPHGRGRLHACASTASKVSASSTPR